MFYDRFISLCNQKGIKPTPLVVSMGLSSSNVSQWKKGSTPRPEVIEKIADFGSIFSESGFQGSGLDFLYFSLHPT